MDAYTLDVIFWHQSNILFVLFAHDIEDDIRYFILRSNIWRSNITVTYHFIQLHKFPITYFYMLWKYYQTGEVGEELGYPIYYCQCNIHLRKSWMIFPV